MSRAWHQRMRELLWSSLAAESRQEDRTAPSGLLDKWLMTAELSGFRFGVSEGQLQHVHISGFPKEWVKAFLDL